MFVVAGLLALLFVLCQPVKEIKLNISRKQASAERDCKRRVENGEAIYLIQKDELVSYLYTIFQRIQKQSF
ncbi:Hypothetical predicted protein [Cloeon dipterum]|uniref:Uncharacterized protein n=1 Tax=Cloeon dipterum TaxID=197152 RepID=A0A8S1DFR2_9INSE|nr:Hypothetical predicted protein [Cloeon dipterum]